MVTPNKWLSQQWSPKCFTLTSLVFTFTTCRQLQQSLPKSHATAQQGYAENALSTPRCVPYPCAHTPSTTWRFLVAVGNGGSRSLSSPLRATNPLPRIGSFCVLSKKGACVYFVPYPSRANAFNEFVVSSCSPKRRLTLIPIPPARERRT